MENKFNMTAEENVFVARRNIVDYIWKGATLEGIPVTYLDTNTIFNGLGVAKVSVDGIIAINNLKRAWQFLIETWDYPVDLKFICEINRIVGEGLVYSAGYIRTVPVAIGGTFWKPGIPVESQVKEDLTEILSIQNATERALTLMLYCMRKQMFVDGNKRTAVLAANQIMISNGAGIIAIPLEFQPEFSELLIQFYETNDMSEIMGFLYMNCIDGIDFRPVGGVGEG